MSLRDKIINGLDTAIKVSTPIIKKTFQALETTSYHSAKHNLKNNSALMSDEQIERAQRVVQRYENKSK